MMTEKVMAMSQEEVLNIALTAGKILLTSGAETYRVEDTIIRLCAWRKMDYVKVFVTPTVIIIGDEKAHGFTCMTRVTARTTNLSLISAVSEMSYGFGKWSLGYQETKLFLEEMRKRPVPSKYVTSFASGITLEGWIPLPEMYFSIAHFSTLRQSIRYSGALLLALRSSSSVSLACTSCSDARSTVARPA